MSAWWEANGLNALIGLLEFAQLGLLRSLAWLGIVDTSHGQPAWPWALKLSGENLLIDLGQARRLTWTLALLALVPVVVLVAMFWRRRRWQLLATVPLLVVVAPWPEAHVAWVQATPTSFHRSPSGFSVESIAQGRVLYAQHCVACHGDDGRGKGPIAALQPVWPPNLAGPLLWRRADGDLLWHVLHGMRDPRGAVSMPAFGDRLQDGEVWALIDFMKAQAAGETLKASGVWALPAALPDAAVRCDGKPARALSSWRGQRIRIVASGDSRTAALLEDPRLVTVRLQPGASGRAPDRPPASTDGCVLDDSDAWIAFSLIAGTTSLDGTEFIADRSGWLRALSRPGQAGWSDDDLLCRTDSAPREVKTAAVADGLGALIRRMDAEPVRFVKGGFVH
ncbi:c-type cytochrome [Variovorax sp. RHLX14]|uniref:c-type cytochrome n=1 Tax=Variovorax sp. RHLX14 TaxID=1259731 RepID=UPI003F452A03